MDAHYMAMLAVPQDPAPNVEELEEGWRYPTLVELLLFMKVIAMWRHEAIIFHPIKATIELESGYSTNWLINVDFMRYTKSDRGLAWAAPRD